MRAGNMWHRVDFYAMVTSTDDYAATVYSWPAATISTRGDIRYTGGGRGANNEEKFYSKSMELMVRYRPEIVETMKVKIDGGSDFYVIGYIEVIGRNQDLRITIEKENA